MVLGEVMGAALVEALGEALEPVLTADLAWGAGLVFLAGTAALFDFLATVLFLEV
jgi:hypothetical protein